MNPSMNVVSRRTASARPLRTRATLQLQRKTISIRKRRASAIDAIAGVIRFQIAAGRNRKQFPNLHRKKRGEQKMEYVIAFGAAAMMGLYVLILAHYLRDA